MIYQDVLPAKVKKETHPLNLYDTLSSSTTEKVVALHRNSNQLFLEIVTHFIKICDIENFAFVISYF